MIRLRRPIMFSIKLWNAKYHPARLVLIFSLLAIPNLIHGGLPTVHASSSPSTNVITNPSFEQGLGPNPSFQVGQGPPQSPAGWDVTTCEGVANATVALDSSRWAVGTESARVSAGPLTNTYCVPTSGIRTGTGFVQLRQFQTGGLTFENLTDSPNAFSFWFYLQPSGIGGMAAFEVRIMGAESIDELDYVFYHDPSLYYGNNSTGGAKAIIYQGYRPGQWYQFSTDLRRDWLAVGLPLNYSFSLVDFEGLVIQNPGSPLESETFWLDDVRVYAGTQPPPTEYHRAYFNFTDSSGKIVDSLVKWKLVDWTGREVAYTMNSTTLPVGPYFVEAYYRALSPDTLISGQQILLDQRQTMRLEMIPNSSLPGGYLIFEYPVNGASVITPDSTSLRVLIQGAATSSNVVMFGVQTQPVLIQGNGLDLSGSDWAYDSALSTIRISFNMLTSTENLTVFFTARPRLPLLSFHDLTGQTLAGQVTFSIFDSQGNLVPYSPGLVVPQGTYLLEAYYQGYRVYRSVLDMASSTPIMLEMLKISPEGYLAINSTATDVSISETSNSQIAFRIEGTGPHLIVVNVSEKPLYLKINGVLTPSWVYNGTTRTVAIETGSQGSFQLVFQETASLDYFYTGGLIGGIAIAGIAGVTLWVRRRPTKHLVTKSSG